MRFQASVGNIFNRTLFCNPNQNFSSPAFGTVNTQCNQAAIGPVWLAVRLLIEGVAVSPWGP